MVKESHQKFYALKKKKYSSSFLKALRAKL